MTQTISAELLAHLSGEVTTTALLMAITPTVGSAIYSTDHDESITYDGNTYLSELGNLPTNFELTSNLAIENVTVDGPYVLTGILYADILAGKYDYAAVTVSLINYADTSQGVMEFFTGNFGEVGPCGDDEFSVELLGFSHRFDQIIGSLYSPGCRNQLGVSPCPVTLSAYTETGSIAVVTSNHEFTCTDLTDVNGHTIVDGWFTGGNLTFTGGANNGLSFEVQDHTITAGPTNTFIFHENTFYNLVAGDTFSVYAGCQKRFAEDCETKYGTVTANGALFNGEPHLPGRDAVMVRPDFKII